MKIPQFALSRISVSGIRISINITVKESWNTINQVTWGMVDNKGFSSNPLTGTGTDTVKDQILT